MQGSREREQALFNTMELLVDELKKTIHASGQLRLDNEKNNEIVKLIKQFYQIKDSADKTNANAKKQILEIRNASKEAISKIKEEAESAIKFSFYPKVLSFLMILVVGALVGLGIGYIGYTQKIHDHVLSKRLDHFYKKEAELKQKYSVIGSMIKLYDAEFYDDGIILNEPPHFTRKDGRIQIVTTE